MNEANPVSVQDSASALPELRPSAALARDFSWTGGPAFGAEAGEGAAAEREIIERLGFRIADLHLVCPFERVSEVAPIPALFRIPNLPPWILGAANLRGNVVPVANLARFLGLQNRVERGMLVVFGGGEDRFGVLADDRPDIHFFAPQHRLHVLPPAPEGLRPHLVTAYEKERVIWLEVDMGALIDGAA